MNIECGCRPGELWLDDNGVHINAHGGGLLHKDGIHYWFGEHKIAGTAGNVAHVGVHVYSSTNLSDWKDRGIALRVSDNEDSEITEGCVIERPKVIYNEATQTFVMWFHLEWKGAGYSAARSAVAVSKEATGPYQFLRSYRPNAGFWPLNAPKSSRVPLDDAEIRYIATLSLGGGSLPEYPLDLLYRRDFEIGQMARDMTVFADDDGIAYHIYSSEENGVTHVSELSADYTSYTGRYSRVLIGGFNEAPALFKRKGKYYLLTSGCTGWLPNAARLSVSDSIWGPYESLGNPCVGSSEEIETTFHSQSTYVLAVDEQQDIFLYLGDRWNPENAIDGRYIWLTLTFEGDHAALKWQDKFKIPRPSLVTHTI